MGAVGRIAAILLGLGAAQPALACSGYSPRHFQYSADVVVAGNVTAKTAAKPEAVTARRVLKGERKRSYPIVWHSLPYDDECAFLAPIPRDRGVFFLKRRDDGVYDVLWIEDRWKMVR
jgi:hypothetical protein